MVASMLEPSWLRNFLAVATTARPPSMTTSNLVSINGIGRGVPATNAPAMKARSGSILVCGAIKVMTGILHKIGEKIDDAFRKRTSVRAAADQFWINHQRDAGRDRERRPFARLEQQPDGRRREAEFAQPAVAPDGRDVVLAIIGVGAAAARRRNETFGDQIADLAFGDARERGELANIHAFSFRQRICRKD